MITCILEFIKRDPKKTSVITAATLVSIIYLVMTVLLLVFSPSANKLANDFTGTCKAGDIAGLEKYSVSQYSEYSDIIKELLAEAEADKLELYQPLVYRQATCQIQMCRNWMTGQAFKPLL